jgi:very-short-patch-repair endonuclease
MNKIIPFEITKQWHPTKNGVLKSENFTKSSQQRIWWLCEKKCKEGCLHEWETTIKDRTAGDGCPFCSPNRLKLCIHDSIVGTHPNVEKQWHPTKNGDLKKEKFGFGSHIKVWWLCEKKCKEGCLHEWYTAISSRCNGVGCPFCSKPQKKNCIHDSIIHTHPEIEKQWHPTKNGDLKTENITFGNGKILAWWKCEKGECHEWTSTVNNRTNGNGCPFCAGQRICKQEKCDGCKVKTFASSDKLNCWNKILNKEKPYEVFISAKKSYWFICNMCNHDFKSSLNNISSGCWCPYCSNLKLCEFVEGQQQEDCSICIKKSFASSDKSDYWIYDKNKGVIPRNIQKYTEKKYWFKCKYGHEFIKRIDLITRRHGWCPYCINKTEQKLYDVLISHYQKLIRQFKVEWCKNINYLPYDFVLEADKIIIELDGLQHFEDVKIFKSKFLEQHKNDVYKMKCANDNGYSVIRILQEDVFYDTYNWLTELRENIEKIKLEKKIQNMYMCKYNEYDIFTT